MARESKGIYFPLRQNITYATSGVGLWGLRVSGVSKGVKTGTTDDDVI